MTQDEKITQMSVTLNSLELRLVWAESRIRELEKEVKK